MKLMDDTDIAPHRQDRNVEGFSAPQRDELSDWRKEQAFLRGDGELLAFRIAFGIISVRRFQIRSYLLPRFFREKLI
jgi:hypothetical protein